MVRRSKRFLNFFSYKKFFFFYKKNLVFFSEMTSKQVHDDNEEMSNTMYKLLKKYQGIKQIVKTLHVSFSAKQKKFNWFHRKKCLLHISFSFRVTMNLASYTQFFQDTTCSKRWLKMSLIILITWNIDMSPESLLNNLALRVSFEISSRKKLPLVSDLQCGQNQWSNFKTKQLCHFSVHLPFNLLQKSVNWFWTLCSNHKSWTLLNLKL